MFAEEEAIVFPIFGNENDLIYSGTWRNMQELKNLFFCSTGNGLVSFWFISKLLLEKHIRFEERILFQPRSRRFSKYEQLAALAKQQLRG